MKTWLSWLLPQIPNNLLSDPQFPTTCSQIHSPNSARKGTVKQGRQLNIYIMWPKKAKTTWSRVAPTEFDPAIRGKWERVQSIQICGYIGWLSELT